MMRWGVDTLTEAIEKADDWVWLVDHSNQIGKEKVLLVLGIRASQLPPPGTPLRHEDLRVLTLRIGTSWKREDMTRVYEELIARFGAPRAILSDGAVELQDGAKPLVLKHKDLLVLRDFKHFAANQLKSVFGQEERFQSFLAEMGRTRSAIQQTELSHLTPPSPKPKARFMNLKATLHWARVASWLVKTPEARQDLLPKRVETKLGWLSGYASDIKAWGECQNVLSCALTFLNEQGVFRGAAAQLRGLLNPLAASDRSRQFLDKLIPLVEQAEISLRDGERLPISTEILESRFGLYKQLEGQQAQGGFTSLLPALAILGTRLTPERVRTAFGRTKTQDIKTWMKTNLGKTVTSRRRSTYANHKRATKQTTPT